MEQQISATRLVFSGSARLLLAGCALTLLAPSIAAQDRTPESAKEGRFRWGPALRQSGMFLGIQHSYRLGLQPSTREELRGPFIRDYFTSVRGLSGWDDGDSALANYVGHPMAGAIAGFIQIQNDPSGMTQEFGSSRQYWRSRLRALAWSAAFSTQYELGPLGEAAIGNVGKTPGTKGAVDLVITPVLGLAWLITEDVLDRRVVLPLEKRLQSPMARLMIRSWLNPSRSFTNALRFKTPWHRDTRPGVSRQ